ADRTGPGTRAQWQSDLARPGVGPRLRGRLSGGEALCAQASWTATSGSRRHHPHRTRRRSASRLRQWSDGARSENRQVSPDTTVCSDPWLQPQVRAPAGVAFEYAHLGRTPREGVSSFRGLSESGGSRFCSREQNRDYVPLPVMCRKNEKHCPILVLRLSKAT